MADYWFALPIVTLIGGLAALAPLGMQVLHRGVVFIDLAVAQAAAAATLWLNVIYHTHDARILLPISVLGAVMCAGSVAWLCRVWPVRREALIGLLYIFSAMLALLAAQFSPHGKEDLQQLLAADLLWSDGNDAMLALICGIIVLTLNRLRQETLTHDLFFYGLFAVVASLMVQILGVFLVFALLIAPAILLEKIRLRIALIVIVAVITSGFILSWNFDLPSGITLTLVLALAGLAASFIQPLNIQE